MLPSELLGRKDWWTGPEWLEKEERATTASESDLGTSHLCLEEERAVQVLNSVAVTRPEPLMDLENYSSSTRVLRVTAWVRRFIQNTRCQSRLTGELTAGELGRRGKALEENLPIRKIWKRRLCTARFQASLSDITSNGIESVLGH
ncbi:hypothetical protein MTO96_010108 [Rhipicephalus appendiculatus]